MLFFLLFYSILENFDIIACESLSFRLHGNMVCVFHPIQVCFSVILEVKDISECVLGKVATTLKEKRHPHIMQY